MTVITTPAPPPPTPSHITQSHNEALITQSNPPQSPALAITHLVPATAESLHFSKPPSEYSTSNHSIEGWLEKTVSSTSTSAASLHGLDQPHRRSPSPDPASPRKLSRYPFEEPQESPSRGEKRKRSCSLSEGEAFTDDQARCLPLTRESLKAYQAAMRPGNRQNPSSTPVRSEGSTAQTPNNRNNPEIEFHNSSSSRGLTTNDIRFNMEQHQMYMEKGLLRKPEFAAFGRLVSEVVKSDRDSNMKAESVQRFQLRADEAAFQDEATMLMRLLPTVTKDRRTLVFEGPLKEGEEGGVMRVDTEYDDSGMRVTADREYKRTFLPNSFSDIGYQDKIAKALAKDQGIKNPKPDRVYGLHVDSFPVPEELQIRNSTQQLLEIVPTLHHPFFLIEAKSNDGNMTMARLQACRGGAALVNSTRLLLAQTGQENLSEGPDARTFIYTSTMDAGLMQFWVNFALVKTLLPEGKKIVQFHMEFLTERSYRSEDAGLELRRICHNIFDWGCLDRGRMLQDRCENIYRFDDRLIKEGRFVELPSKKRKGNNSGLIDSNISCGLPSGC